MTAKELIEVLNKADPNAEVSFCGGRDSFPYRVLGASVERYNGEDRMQVCLY